MLPRVNSVNRIRLPGAPCEQSNRIEHWYWPILCYRFFVNASRSSLRSCPFCGHAGGRPGMLATYGFFCPHGAHEFVVPGTSSRVCPVPPVPPLPRGATCARVCGQLTY